MEQDKKTGELTPVKSKKIDFSDVNGLWIPCNGSFSPWNTHLGSEEYEPDARKFELVEFIRKNPVESFCYSSILEINQKLILISMDISPEITVDKNGETKSRKTL